jgi:uncharacterized glyoxalase superfamily protein PhnB
MEIADRRFLLQNCAAPEIRVSDVAKAALYYENCLGFNWDWGASGIGQVSRGGRRIFLTDNQFRGDEGTGTPLVIWINLNSKEEVNALHEAWNSGGARIVSKPESKPWNLHEFTAEDLDGNQFRVFYDFAWELADRGGRPDPGAEREEARARLTRWTHSVPPYAQCSLPSQATTRKIPPALYDGVFALATAIAQPDANPLGAVDEIKASDA